MSGRFPISPVFVRHANPNREHLISVVNSILHVPFLIVPVHRDGGSLDYRQSLRKANPNRLRAIAGPRGSCDAILGRKPQRPSE